MTAIPMATDATQSKEQLMDEMVKRYWQRRLDLWRLLQALLEMPEHTLWCGGDMEEGPFARLVLPQADGGYTGGYVEAQADTPAEAIRAALRAQATSRGGETPANLKQGSQDSDQLKVRATFAQESGVSRNNDGGDNG